MKAYVVIIEGRNIDRGVSIHWSNTECAAEIIDLANSMLTDGSHISTLGVALRALDNMGVDVSTHPIDVQLPDVDLQAAYVDNDFCGDCGVNISQAQAKLSKARFDGAPAECKDCCTRKLSGTPVAGKKARRNK